MRGNERTSFMKVVKQGYLPHSGLPGLLDDLGRMVNDCLGIGLAENVASMKALSKMDS